MDRSLIVRLQLHAIRVEHYLNKRGARQEKLDRAPQTFNFGWHQPMRTTFYASQPKTRDLSYRELFLGDGDGDAAAKRPRGMASASTTQAK